MIEGKPPANIFMRAWPDLLQRGITVRLGAYDEAAQKWWRLASGKWDEQDPYTYTDGLEHDLMVMRMDQNMTQRLFDDLWQAGFRPKEQPDMDRLLAEAHKHNELLVRVVEALAVG